MKVTPKTKKRTGPPPLSKEEKRARGSWLAGPRRQHPTKARPKSAPRRRRRVGIDWDAVILELPGYDPWRLAGDCTFNGDKADAVYKFFCDELVHVIGRFGGKPFIPQRWQLAALGNLYGWVRPDGTRRYRECYESVARKNGKTTRAAGQALYELMNPVEHGAFICSAASTRQQARLVWDQAKGMIMRNARLWDQVNVFQHAINRKDDFLTHYKPISAEAGTSHGENPQFAVIDELHLQPNRNLVDAIKTGMGARIQPMVVYLTTAGHDVTTICYEVYQRACDVRDGVSNDAEFLPVIYEFPKDADWKDQALWKLANPNLGITVQEEFLQAEFKRAVKNPAYENTFRNLYLNQWVEQAERWISVDTWNKCGGDVPDDKLRGRDCWLGLDLSLTRDLSALVAAFPMDDGRIVLRASFWLPMGEHDNLTDRGKADRIDYQKWVQQKLIEVMPTRRTDFPAIRQKILDWNRLYRIKEVAFDPYAAGELTTKLANEDALPMVEHRQGTVSMGPACKNFEGMVLEGKLAHGGHEILAWNMANVAIARDASDNIRLDKKNSTGRIDGIVASVMAVGRCLATWNPSAGMGIVWLNV